MRAPFHELRIAFVRDEAEGVRSFALSVPAHLSRAFAYRAGQYVTLEVACAGATLRRCYSLSSAPESGEPPTITVKRVAGGRVSNWLLDHVREGDALRVAPPEGRFVLDPAEPRAPLTLLAAGSGITPILSIARSALATTHRPVRLVFANLRHDAVPFAAALRDLAKREPRLSLHLHGDDQDGRLDGPALRRLVGANAGDFYVCGPHGFMELCEAELEALGVPPWRMHFERFVSPADPAPAVPAPAGAAGTFRLRMAGALHVLPHDGSQTLLQAARAAGLTPAASCEDGYCGTCMAQCVRGEVRMARSEALTTRELGRGRILLCQARAASDELEVDCDAVAFRPLTATRRAQPLAPRVLASLFVCLVFAAYFALR